jgi:hypothetical protein
MKVDNSLLKATARCSTEAVWRYHLGYTTRDEHAALGVGTAAHAALDTYLSSGGTDPKPAMNMLKHEYDDLDLDNPDARFRWDNVKAVMGQWFAEHTLEQMPWLLDEATFETDFAVKLTDDLDFCGRLDGIVRNKVDGRWYVLEHKTTGRLTSFWTQQWQTSSQLTGYIWAGAVLKEKPIVGAFVNAIEMAKLPDPEPKKCVTHKVPKQECWQSHTKFEIIVTQRTPQQITAWQANVVRLAKRFDALRQRYPTMDHAYATPQEGTFHGACSYCTFKQFCQTGRRPELVESLLVYRPWEVTADGE